MNNFAALALPPALIKAVDVLGFTQMTPVQAQALPPILAGKDVITEARTGSGKTVAFGLGLLAGINARLHRVQALVLCPTRELADQVSTELRRLARFIPNLKIVTLCGGVPVRTQAPSLDPPPQVVVGTPGRLVDHLQRENLELGALRVLVLDEADRMLDMGFADSVAEVVSHTPHQKQTLLFSATFPDEIRALSGRMQNAPVTVTVETPEDVNDIEQKFYEVEGARKLDALLLLLAKFNPESALIFCHTRQDTRDVAARLSDRGYAALALHGELEQRERDEVLLCFANKSCSILVATDVAARGLDIKGLPAVISWELPIDPDIHTHRIGRTGRAGQKGLALSLCAPREHQRADAIISNLKHAAHWDSINFQQLGSLPTPPEAPMVTLVIDGGKQDKLRAGDILGALTGDIGIAASRVGKIDIHARRSYVAISRDAASEVLRELRKSKIKGKTFRAAILMISAKRNTDTD